MKIALVRVSSSRESWSEGALEQYTEKIGRFSSFEIIEVKSKPLNRAARLQKVEMEAELILKRISPRDYLVLLDERGKAYSSLEFSHRMQRWLESGNSRVVFVIGGAFGVSEELKKRANESLSLSHLVFNHHVAAVVLCEQIYRAFTILKNLPYHND